MLDLKRPLCTVLLAAGLLLTVASSAAFAGFGFQRVENTIVNQDGSADVQAGSHPFAIETTFKLNERVQPNGVSIPDGDLKDLEVKLPPGLAGNATATPKCSIEQFHTPDPHLAGGLSGASCPEDTQIGIARVELNTAGAATPRDRSTSACTTWWRPPACRPRSASIRWVSPSC